VSLPIQKSTTKTASLPIQEIGSQNYVPVDFWQQKTASLSIQEISSENYVVAYSEIGSENYVLADFWQQKTASLPIQKSAVMVESSILYIYIFFFSFRCLHSTPLNMNFVLKI
jgi:hypothetical protein